MPSGRILTALMLMLLGASALAQAPTPGPDTFKLCPANPAFVPPPPSTAVHPRGTAHFSADRARASGKDEIHLSGNATADRGDRRVWADLIDYFRNTQILTASGNLRYSSPTLGLTADHMQYDFADDHGIFWNDKYFLPARHGRGSASKISTQASDKTHLSELTYTTCPPGDASWYLHASHVTLNHDTEIGYATNAWISFKGVPLLWWPYLTFPLTDARKSGFLAPSIARSSTSGLDVEVPYYFNIAPNFDMTLTPRFLSQRGLMMMDTTRWLLPGTRGQFHFEYLPHDRKANRTRGLANLNDTTQLGSHWRINTNIEYVSDPNYFDDLGNSLRQVAQAYQTRKVTATYQVPSGSAYISVQDEAPLDPAITPAQRPYRKLPQVGFDFAWPLYPSRLTPGFFGDVTHFEAPGRQNALRAHLRPYLRADYGSASWSVIPTFGFDAARYNLDAYGGQPRHSINRTAPVFSLDTSLDFERAWGRNGWLTQTLEPRAYYLYVPYRNQSNIPVFDTYLPPLDMQRLFSDNRFSGPDRLGDANRLSLGLTSRFLDNNNGRQLVTLGFGQAFYFRNREVTLPGEAPQTQARSDYVGELTTNLGHHLITRVVGDYNPYTHDFDQGYVSLQYQPAPFQVINVGYLYRRGQLDQSDVSFAWPVTQRWSVVGRWNYSVQDHQTLENMLGLQYESCCWRFRIVQRRFVTLNGQGNSALYFELQLKGLGSLGNRLSDFLHDDIQGYGQNTD